MTIAEIREFPNHVTGLGRGMHESCMRSYQCVQKVRELLRKCTPPDVLVEIIDDIMDAPERSMSIDPGID